MRIGLLTSFVPTFRVAPYHVPLSLSAHLRSEAKDLYITCVSFPRATLHAYVTNMRACGRPRRQKWTDTISCRNAIKVHNEICLGAFGALTGMDTTSCKTVKKVKSLQNSQISISGHPAFLLNLTEVPAS